ncbi:hypothetical protein ACETK8_20130 (plasmid) [Brevundimonas staleyi]|uniref:Uncharacterized protein n=1 Tax=Brevundimonas staleyi TaxID=74326 RepID=A0ABW0FPN8_9CAUL
MTITIFPVRYTQAQLMAAPEDERLFHLMAGQCANDLNVLAKLHLMVANSAGDSRLDGAETSVFGSFVIRQMVGRLYEAWKLFKDRFHLIYLGYEGEWSPQSVQAWAEMKRYFGSGSLLMALRHKVSFHADADVMRDGFARVPHDVALTDYVGFAAGNALYAGSDAVLTLAMASLTGIADTQAAMDQIYDEMARAHGWVNDLTLDYFNLFVGRHIDVTPETLSAGRMEIAAPRLSALKTHFFVDYEETPAEREG